jgi:hypothetical protein
MAGATSKPPEWRRWLGIACRTAHIGAITWLAAQLFGTHDGSRLPALLVFASGAALFASELFDRRVHVLDLAGLVVVAKLGAVGAMVVWPASAAPLFWVLLAVSSVSSHAPRPLRHWRPPGAR